jgi:putative hemolysin
LGLIDDSSRFLSTVQIGITVVGITYLSLIEGVLGLADRSVRVIMTPRTRVVWVDMKSDRNTIIDMVQSHRVSRLLVCDKTVDRPVGFVHTKNLLPEALRCEDVTLADLAMPLLYVPDRTTVLNLLNRFKKEKVQLAVVVDEYGTTEGLVTLTDVVEAIAGDLPERGEDHGPQIVRRDDGSLLVDGTVPTDEVETITGLDMGKEVEMLAGFVLDHLGRIPEAGASFRHGNARFEVVDMDGNRIDKVLIEVGPKSDEAPRLRFTQSLAAGTRLDRLLNFLQIERARSLTGGILLHRHIDLNRP